MNRGAINFDDGSNNDHMETVGDWQALMGNGAISATLTAVSGYSGQALQLNYNLGTTPGAWAQLRRDFNPPLNLSADDHCAFSIEVP